MSNSSVDILKRALERERKAKLIAEDFVGKRLRELYLENVSLTQNLSTQEEFQKHLIDNLVDALFVVDFKGNILKVNKEAKLLIGVDDDNVPNNINEFSVVNRDRINKYFSKSNYQENHSEFQFQFYNRKKEHKVVTIKSRILINTKNKPYAYQAIVRDVTENFELDLKIKEQLEVKKFEALILKDLLTSNDIFNNAWTLVNHIANFLKTDDCVFYGLVNNKLIQLAATGNKISSDKTILNKLKIPITDGVIGQVARSKKGIIVKSEEFALTLCA